HLAGADATFVIVTASGFALLAFAFARLARTVSRDGAAAFTMVVLSTPLLLVVTRWMGKSDPLVIALYVLLLAAAPVARLRADARPRRHARVSPPGAAVAAAVARGDRARSRARDPRRLHRQPGRAPRVLAGLVVDLPRDPRAPHRRAGAAGSSSP